MISDEKIKELLFCSEEQYLNTVYALRENNKLSRFFELSPATCNKMSDHDIRRLYHHAVDACFGILSEDVIHAAEDDNEEMANTLATELEAGKAIVVHAIDPKFGKVRLELVATLTNDKVRAAIHHELFKLENILQTIEKLFLELETIEQQETSAGKVLH